MRKQSDKNKFLERLSTTPIVSVVCRQTNISKASVYRWLQKDKDFAKRYSDALEEGRHTLIDLAMSGLMLHLSKKEPWAIRYCLDNNDPRYIKPRRASSGIEILGPVTSITYVERKSKEIKKPEEGSTPEATVVLS